MVPVAPSGSRTCRWKRLASTAAGRGRRAAMRVTPKGGPFGRKPAGTAIADRSIRFTKLV